MWLPISWGKTVVQRRFGMFEPWSFSVCDRVAKPGMVVVELGACYGALTIHLSRLVGPTGRVYAFEPFPKYYSILCRNVALNQLDNVECINLAIAPRGVERIDFDSAAINPYGSLGEISGYQYPTPPVVPGAGDARRDRVPCMTLPDFMDSRNISMDLLFMDVEGCEVGVVADVEPVLRACGARPIVYMETHAQFYGFAERDRMREVLTESGYKIETIGGHWLCTPHAPEPTDDGPL